VLSTMKSKRVKFGLLGLIYGVIFWAWAALGSGGGHYNLPLALATPIGFVFWPVLWIVAADLHSTRSRVAFLVLLACDYASLAYYLLSPDIRSSDAYWYGIAARNESSYVLFPVISIAMYGAGQMFLWRLFIKALHRRNVP